MAILKRKSFQRETGLMDEESYQEYLKKARPLTPSERYEKDVKNIIEVPEEELDMFAKYGVKVIVAGKTEYKLTKKKK